MPLEDELMEELEVPSVEPVPLSTVPVVCVPVFGIPGVAVEALYQSATPMTRRTRMIAAAIQYAVVEELFITIECVN